MIEHWLGKLAGFNFDFHSFQLIESVIVEQLRQSFYDFTVRVSEAAKVESSDHGRAGES